MTGDVRINGYDAYTEWRVNFEDGAISALMTPASLKEFVEGKSRLQHGKRVVVNSPKMEEREVTLPFHIVASSKEEFFYYYRKFCREVLMAGEFTLTSRWEPSVTYNGVSVPQPVYHLIYQSCTQFRQFDGKMAVFSLKVTEPNPDNRI